MRLLLANDNSGGRSVCHNNSNDGHAPSDIARVCENDVGATYCQKCGSIILSDGYGNFPDACSGCGGILDWSEWDKHNAPSSTAGDYGPGNPWDAPGMSVRDFI